MLTGTLSSIEALKRLEVVLLADNSLQGNLPRFEGWNWLQTVNLTNDRLSGEVSASWGYRICKLSPQRI